MTRINKNTKRWEELQRDFRHYCALGENDLFDVYNSVSCTKYRTYVSWIDWVHNNYKYADYVKVLGGNTFAYTLGFTYSDEETGVLNFVKITKDNVYAIEL